MGQAITSPLAYYVPFLQPVLRPFMNEDQLQILRFQQFLDKWLQQTPNNIALNNNENIINNNNNNITMATREEILEAISSPSPYRELFIDDDSDNYDNNDEKEKEEEEDNDRDAFDNVETDKEFYSPNARRNINNTSSFMINNSDDDSNSDDDDDSDDQCDNYGDDNDDNADDNDANDDADIQISRALDYINGISQSFNPPPGKSERNRREGRIRGWVHCKHCRNAIKIEAGVHCRTCKNEWDLYCNQECLRRGKRKHKETCDLLLQAKIMETVIQLDYQGELFGCIDDLPGLEHDFLGGSKLSIILKIGRKAPGFGGVFHCKDKRGQNIKLKLEGVDGDTLQAVSRRHPNFYACVHKAFIQRIKNHNDPYNIGIVLRARDEFLQTVIFYQYRGKNQDGTFLIEKIPLDKSRPEIYHHFQYHYRIPSV